MYKINKELHDLVKENYPSLGLVWIENDEYFIEKFHLERCKGEPILGIDQYFMDNFGENADTYLTNFNVSPHRIMSYVSNHFNDYKIENIDFKIHLKSDTAVVKCNRIFHDNGKPNYVEYKIDGVYVARRKWEFIVDPVTSFPQDIKEYLAYYKENSILGEYFLIKHSVYDPMMDSDEIMSQLELPRKNIIKQLKSLIYTNLSVADPTMSHENKLKTSGAFFRDYADVINLFVEIGLARSSDPNDDYVINRLERDSIADNGVYKYPFLNHPYFMDGMKTLVEVIIAKLDY